MTNNPLWLWIVGWWRRMRSPGAVERLGPGHMIRSIAVDEDGVFYVALSRKLLVLIIAIAVCLALGISTLSIVALRNAAHIGSDSRRIARAELALHDSALGQCRRVQLLRDSLNEFGGSVYVFISAAHAARLAAYQRSHDKADLYAVEAYGVILKSIRYSPPTTCQRAVDSPLTYPAPKLIPYGKAIKGGLVTTPPLPPPPK